MAKAPNCKGRIVGVRWLAPDILELDVEMVEPAELHFEAGQWVSLPFGPKTVRPYTIASPPSERRVFRLCADVTPGGVGSRFLRGVKPGEELAFHSPLGNLTLIRGSSAEVILVAEEIGIVPFRSILLGEAERGFPRRMRLYYGAPRRELLIYHEEFEKLARRHSEFGYAPILEEAEPGPGGGSGDLLKLLARELPELAGREALICGGGKMVKACRELFMSRGMERRAIRYEKFW